jgi:predicted O-methyltransferase YrrM
MDVDRTDKQFTRNWFTQRNRPTFIEYVLPKWANQPITYLELGIFEGMSMVWMMQYVLTHPQSRAVGIDPWLQTMKQDNAYMEEVWGRAVHNLKSYPTCQLVRCTSAVALRKMLHRRGWCGLSRASVDVCMIDGEHNALAVLDDAILAVQLLKPGGWLLFDDVENKGNFDDHVKHGIKMFLESNPGVHQLWKHGHMECYEKRQGT